MLLRTCAWLLFIGLVGWNVASFGGVSIVDARSVEAEGAERLQSALDTQAATRIHLRVLGDAFSCDVAQFVSYRRSDMDRETVDQWYVTSQLWADAVLLSALATYGGHGSSTSSWDDPDGHCHLDRGFVFLDRLWDYQHSGYAPRSNLAGTSVERETRYVDDNALAGLVLLAAAEATSDQTLKGRYLHAAERGAEFLIESEVWDEVFGGGFWWTTDKGDTLEGKPAQTNALAALLFGRLHQATGQEVYRLWALRTLLWMDTILYDPERQLYRWSVHYQDPDSRSGAVLSERYFNYDQAIAIEAQLAAAELDGDPVRHPRARGVGEALHADFWSQARGGYNLEAGVDQVYTAYAAWSSLGHLALYDLDGDPRWLNFARANADALTATLGKADGGYGYRHYRCVDRWSDGCWNGRTARVADFTRDTTAQAWMQHLQTALSLRLAVPEPPK